MGSKPGNLEHPHYIAVSNTNRVIVSDSNNHRIQIFDVNGKVLTTFGSEGTDAGQFKFPRSVQKIFLVNNTCIFNIAGEWLLTTRVTFTSQTPAIIVSKFSTPTEHSSDALEDGVK